MLAHQIYLARTGDVLRGMIWSIIQKIFGLAWFSWLIVIPAITADDRTSAEADYNWPHWRGPLATGVAPHGDPPREWNENKNVRWKIPLPGRGHSTPIIWRDRLFLTTAIPVGPSVGPIFDRAPGSHDNAPVTHQQEFVVLAVSRADGKILWQKSLDKRLPHEGGHHTGSMASNSPVTDGELLFAHFGSRGLYCLTLDGDVKWKSDFGEMQSLHGHGEGSSPVLYGDTVVVNWDHEGQSFVIALDKRTGRQIWKVLREEITSWASPIVVEHRSTPQIIISGTNRVRGYDLANGKVIWECGGLSANVVASPVSADGIVYVGSSYDKRALMAIRLEGAVGNITDTKQVLWNRYRGTPYVPSPLLYEDSLYFLTHYQGILTRVHGPTGEDRPGAIRLPGITDIYASPVAAANRVYVTDREGATAVIQHGDIPRILAMNQIDDNVSASAALSGNEMFLRGERFLYCIAEK
jgi:outer membrane protein assembly factor BamB